ncbi:MAG: hypothetical protein QNI87_10450 [Erythrobacter sp.]|nr:tetratricopeptide repeat protein [Erythrobacter sp.]MDJ0978945.1 hypothetical protein [Erythrobacter sp.]
MPKALARSSFPKVALSAFLLAPALVVAAPIPAQAQDEVSEARLRKIEAEIRALQRNVFPGGDERYFEPEITSVDPNVTRATGPSTTAVTDILARLDAIEQQLTQLTAITEENANAISLLATRIAAIEAGGAPQIGAADAASSPLETTTTVAQDAVEDAAEAAEEPRAMTSNLAAMGAGPSVGLTEEAETTPQPQGPTPERLAAVQEIAKPQTSDAADDEYSYGFRLWDAGFYPEARQQLSSFLDSYPDHWRATYGRNLLGRAYLDDGKPEDAARWFLKNYQTDRTAARAPDSLLFLADSMIALDDTRRACIALAEFAETYPAVATGRLLERYQASRRKVTCES